MSKSNHFFGQPVFGQLLQFINPTLVARSVRKTNSDRYTKRFKTWDHLISMLFVSLSGCTSLREVAGALLGMKGKTGHFKLTHLPYRSTLSDANARRTPEVFSMIYSGLVKEFSYLLSDSRALHWFGKPLKILDSTTIGLFKDFMKCAGRKSLNGKSKGGIKVHSMINSNELFPRFIHFTDGSHNDQRFLKVLQFEPGHIYVFDKGYNSYEVFENFTEREIGFVTRLKENAAYELMIDLDIPWDDRKEILKDQIIELPIRKNGEIIRMITARLVTFWDEKHQRSFAFLTNEMNLEAKNVAEVYKQRWQIELLHKQLKQNFSLKYFLGDNSNAVIIQIWAVLIANLLLVMLRKKLKRKWAFANIASFIRINLINYLNLISFLENPEKDWKQEINLAQSEFDFETG